MQQQKGNNLLDFHAKTREKLVKKKNKNKEREKNKMGKILLRISKVICQTEQENLTNTYFCFYFVFPLLFW